MHLLTFLSMVFNFLTWGLWGETFCCRVFRRCIYPHIFPAGFWVFLRRVIDKTVRRLTGEKTHCFNQYRKYSLDRAKLRKDILQRAAT